VDPVTHSELRTLTLQRAGQDPTASGYFTGAMATAALNRSLRLFVLRSLCVERTDTYTLVAGAAWSHVLTQFADFLLPLRLEYAGARLRPARLSELDALSATWQATAGDPERYSLAGLDLLAVYKQLAAGGTLSVLYAGAPERMSDDADVPEIPAEYHEDLVAGAIPLMRLAEGGQELDKALPGLKRLFDAAAKLAGYVRQRSLDLRYDRLPAELERYDLSRWLAMERRRAPWLMDSASRPAPAQQ
jgi:hypothetical protein